jgi:hypothetical protein
MHPICSLKQLYALSELRLYFSEAQRLIRTSTCRISNYGVAGCFEMKSKDAQGWHEYRRGDFGIFKCRLGADQY